VNVPIFLPLAVMQWLTGVILDAHWTGLVSAGVRLYPAEGYRAGAKTSGGTRARCADRHTRAGAASAVSS
jgi:hypothetical protein